MPAAISVRTDFSASELQRLAAATKHASQSRRLLSIAAVLDRMNRTEAAWIGAWTARHCALGLKIPKLRMGSYFPPFLEARNTAERALVAVIQEAWITGVSTRRVDDLVQAMGLSGIPKSQVSNCARRSTSACSPF
jgi:Transposase, Mutator family